MLMVTGNGKVGKTMGRPSQAPVPPEGKGCCGHPAPVFPPGPGCLQLELSMQSGGSSASSGGQATDNNVPICPSNLER